MVLLKVLRKICGPECDEVTDEWRTLHNKEHHDLYCSRSIIWVIKQRRRRWAGNVACIGHRAESSCIQNFGGDKRPLERSRHRWENKMKVNLQQTGWRTADWVDLAQDRNRWRLVGKTNEPSSSIKCGEFLDQLRNC